MAMGGHHTGALVTFLQRFRKERHSPKSEGTSEEDKLDSQSITSSNDCPSKSLPCNDSSLHYSCQKPVSLSSLPVSSKSHEKLNRKPNCLQAQHTLYPPSRHDSSTTSVMSKSSKWPYRFFSNSKTSRKNSSKESSSSTCDGGAINIACSEDLDTSIRPYCWPTLGSSFKTGSDSSFHPDVVSSPSSHSPSLHDPQTQCQCSSPNTTVMPNNISSSSSPPRHENELFGSNNSCITKEAMKSASVPCQATHLLHTATHWVDIPLLRDSPGVIPSAPCLRHLSPSAPCAIAPNVFPFKDGNRTLCLNSFYSFSDQLLPSDSKTRSKPKMTRKEKQKDFLHAASELDNKSCGKLTNHSRQPRFTGSRGAKFHPVADSLDFSYSRLSTVSSTSQALLS